MKFRNFIPIIFVFFSSSAVAQFFNAESPLVHTYSIVAKDTVTGEMGVAVQSHWFSVGSVVGWAESGAGVVATQSLVNISFGPEGLTLLREGLSAQQVVDSLVKSDGGRDFRQLAVIDSRGNAAAYTGTKCIPYAGHITGENFSVQANLMIDSTVWPAMYKAYTRADGPLAERMIAALEAAQNVGGDIRGQQSASILIVKGKSSGKVWEDKLIDLRVEDHPAPVEELKRLLKVHRAYEHMNNGDLALEKGDMKKALEEYSTAESMFPGNEEMKFWHAVTLANNDKVEESLILFKEIFSRNRNWKILLPRLVPIGLLTADYENLKRILELSPE